MIRTKDFFLFIVVFLFLSLAITATVWRGVNNSGSERGQVTDFVTEDNSITASAPIGQTSPDRTANILALREKIAADTSVITPVPSVEAPAVTLGDEDTKMKSEPKKCLYSDDMLAKVPMWPLQDVSIEVVEGARVITHTEKVVQQDSEASTTPLAVSEVVKKSLIQLPISVVSNGQENCLPSEVIGVSQNGYLMFNTDTKFYRALSPDTLIGYARDGFPIYGSYSGEVDTCGGYKVNGQYRYTISPDRNYILGCFSANPQKFNI